MYAQEVSIEIKPFYVGTGKHQHEEYSENTVVRLWKVTLSNKYSWEVLRGTQHMVSQYVADEYYGQDWHLEPYDFLAQTHKIINITEKKETVMKETPNKPETAFPSMPMGTTDTLTEETATLLTQEIEEAMGPEYVSTIAPYNPENPEIGFYVDLWTRRTLPLGNIVKDQLIGTFSNTRQWFLFKECARMFVRNQEVKEFEEYLKHGPSGGSPFEADHSPSDIELSQENAPF